VTRVLVTGATGFVGRAAVAALGLQGHEVHGTARVTAGDVSVDAWHRADLLDPAGVDRLVQESACTHLLHLAWTAEQPTYSSDPANLAWARATCALVDAFAAAGGRRVVAAGTCAQYSWDPDVIGAEGFVSEAVTPRRPTSLYGRAKQATTDLLEAWSAETGLSFATALLFVPYGPFDRPERLVPSVTRSLLAGETAEVRSGNNVHDFLHVEDCGAALAALLDSDVTGPVNVGSGQGTSVADVASTLGRIVGREDLLRIAPASGGGEIRLVARTTRLNEEVGFQPFRGLEAGLEATVDWLRERLA
jgi:nucleoside-diphosphate-sugar epimerase